jgi:hypothetical protein
MHGKQGTCIRAQLQVIHVVYSGLSRLLISNEGTGAGQMSDNNAQLAMLFHKSTSCLPSAQHNVVERTVWV